MGHFPSRVAELAARTGLEVYQRVVCTDAALARTRAACPDVAVAEVSAWRAVHTDADMGFLSVSPR